MEKFSSLETAEKWLDPERMRQLRRSCATNRGNPTIESNEIERKSGLSREESAVSTIYECKKKRREMLSESNVAEKRKKETRASNGVFKLDGIDRGDILRARWRSITVERNLDLDKQRRAIGKWKRETPLPLYPRGNPGLSCFLTFPPGQWHPRWSVGSRKFRSRGLENGPSRDFRSFFLFLGEKYTRRGDGATRMRMFIDSFLAEVEDDDANRRGFRKKARRESKTGRIFYGYPRILDNDWEHRGYSHVTVF